MSRIEMTERPLPADETDDDFDAWTLDDLDEFADEHALRARAAHDADD